MDTIFKACEDNDLNFIKEIVANGHAKKTNIHDCSFKTPLFTVCLFGYTEILDILVASGIDVNKNCDYIRGHLHVLCITGNIYMVNTLINNGVNVNLVDIRKTSPLHYACYNGTINILYIKDYIRGSIRGCINKEVYTDIVKELIIAGADVNALDKQGNTPLHIACKKRNVSTVNVLIEAGADINALDKQGNTPLHIACKTGYVPIVNILIEAGVDNILRDNKDM